MVLFILCYEISDLFIILIISLLANFSKSLKYAMLIFILNQDTYHDVF